MIKERERERLGNARKATKIARTNIRKLVRPYSLTAICTEMIGIVASLRA